jgi:hypothetical protein
VLELIVLFAGLAPVIGAIYFCYLVGKTFDELKNRKWRFTIREVLVLFAVCSLILTSYVWFRYLTTLHIYKYLG